jgi:hypothetical protein
MLDHSMRHVNIRLEFRDRDPVRMVIIEDDGPDRPYSVDPGEAAAVLDLLTRALPAMIPSPAWGIDGVLYSVGVEAGENHVDWVWYETVPPGWSDLGRIAERLIALAEPRLSGPLIEGP